MSKDPYAALGLTKTATDDEIKKAYRKIARTCHPDLKPGDTAAEDRFKAASAAYDLLKDPETRARFDRGEIDASGAERPDRQFYRDYAEAPGNPYRSGPSGQQSHDFGDASDIFSEFMRQRGGGGGGHAGQGFQARGPDQRYALEIPFLDAVQGSKTQIVLPGGGALSVTIPPGTADGQTLRLRGKGSAGFGGGPAGDALVTLSVLPHPLFRREGNDIHIILPITLDEAVLGAKIATRTIAGSVTLTIPKGASSGQMLRLRGRGVKPKGAAAAGDQKVELSIVSPPKIDDDLAEFMQNWRKTHDYDPRKGMAS
ncbi:MAG: DnaJ-class molecular chaperone [Paracoccaceae bacterium]|jgi:DnaJ-class molecular chaperone